MPLDPAELKGFAARAKGADDDQHPAAKPRPPHESHAAPDAGKPNGKLLEEIEQSFPGIGKIIDDIQEAQDEGDKGEVSTHLNKLFDAIAGHATGDAEADDDDDDSGEGDHHAGGSDEDDGAADDDKGDQETDDGDSEGGGEADSDDDDPDDDSEGESDRDGGDGDSSKEHPDTEDKGDDEFSDVVVPDKASAASKKLMDGYTGEPNPPSMVADESTWNKAKAKVGGKDNATHDDIEGSKYDEPWAVVMDVYKKMGGKVKSKGSDKKDDEE